MEEYKSAAYKYIETKGNKEQKKANSKYQKAIAKINFYDIHPQSIQRVNEELKLLKRELAKEDLDPKVKEILEEQISQLEEKLKEFTTTSKKLSKNDNAQRLFNAYINDEFPDAVSEEIEEKIEEALDKLLDEAK